MRIGRARSGLPCRSRNTMIRLARNSYRKHKAWARALAQLGPGDSILLWLTQEELLRTWALRRRRHALDPESLWELLGGCPEMIPGHDFFET